jgi:hypothetical protein
MRGRTGGRLPVKQMVNKNFLEGEGKSALDATRSQYMAV